MLEDKVVLITGGTGSFGKKFIEMALKSYNPRKLIVFSRDELKQQQVLQQFCDPRLSFFIGDVRDRALLDSGAQGHVAVREC